MKRKIISVIFILLLISALTANAFAIVGPSSEFYSADYANVLSSETEEMIINYNGSLEQQCSGAQIVVVTVRYLDGMYCDDYAYQLFNDWGVGSAQYNNGVLLLLATEEGKAWLATGYGISGSLDADQMLDRYFWDDFDSGNFDKAVTKLFKALLEWFDDNYSASTASSAATQNYDYYPNSSQYSYQSHSNSGSGLRTVVIILIILVLLNGRSSGRGRSGIGSWLPWALLFSSRNRGNNYSSYDDWNRRGPRGPGGFGGGSGHGGGGFSGGGGGRR